MIQGVYDKILNFCGLPKIACVIVGSKSDLSMSYDLPHARVTLGVCSDHILGVKSIRLTEKD